jgi:hypothetical protein
MEPGRASPGLTAFLAIAAAAGCGHAVVDDGVDISRGSSEVDEWLDLDIVGEGFDAVEGRPVEVQVGSPDRPPERLGHAVTAVEEGAFAVLLPEVLEPGLTKRKVVWIDADGDGACGEIDLVFADYSVALADFTLELARYREAQSLLARCDSVVVAWPSE